MATSKRSRLATVLALVAITATAGAAGFACGKSSEVRADAAQTDPTAATTAPPPPVTAAQATATAAPVGVQTGPLSFAPVVKLADQSVVTINTAGEETRGVKG